MSKNQETCDINLGGNLRIGEFPRVPIRYLLNQARFDAMGYTLSDLKAMGKLKEGDDPIQPSERGDGYALALTYYAAIGLCWPDKIEPTFRKLRHDVLDFGEVCHEYFQDHKSVDHIEARDAGRDLLTAMMAGPTERLREAVDLEADFTEGQEGTSTT